MISDYLPDWINDRFNNITIVVMYNAILVEIFANMKNNPCGSKYG